MSLAAAAADDHRIALVEVDSRHADLRVEGLSKAFDAGAPVFEQVGFVVRRGEAVALVGANGAGKSTLLRCAVGLIPPTAGQIELLGEAVDGAGARSLRRVRTRIGFVFQRHNLVPRLSALSNVVHGALGRHWGPRFWCHGLAPARVRERAMHALDLVGLADIAGRRADRLSGGQSQRVAIARALMPRPELIIADEPVASLDPAAGEEVMQLFARLMRQEGLTVIFTTHNVDHALWHADRVLALKDRRLVLDAPSAGLDRVMLRTLYD